MGSDIVALELRPSVTLALFGSRSNAGLIAQNASGPDNFDGDAHTSPRRGAVVGVGVVQWAVLSGMVAARARRALLTRCCEACGHDVIRPWSNRQSAITVALYATRVKPLPN